jgi:NAD(P)-dependent dehydrogenase (short-subunit alcohol dehydrogenase family)
MGDLLAGRVAIVTGAGRGIGAAIATLFASEGAQVLINDLGVEPDGRSPDDSPANKVVADIEKNGGVAVANHADVGDFEAAKAMVDQAVEVFGRLDVLVNVAGILRDRMLFNMSEDDFDSVVRVHLKGTFNTCRHASAYWREQKNPAGNFRIINTTSGAGIHGGPTQPNYAAAKTGIIGLTYSCANALTRYGVTSNCISPAALTRMTGTIPEGGLGLDAGDPNLAASNVAPAVAYLASEHSGWCNGQVLAMYGKKLGLYTRPDMKTAITSPVPWTIESAAQAMEETIRPATAGTYDPYNP